MGELPPLVAAHLWQNALAVADGGRGRVQWEEVKDYVNTVFEDTSLVVVDTRTYSNGETFLTYEVDDGDDALISIAARIAENFVNGRVVVVPPHTIWS